MNKFSQADTSLYFLDGDGCINAQIVKRPDYKLKFNYSPQHLPSEVGGIGSLAFRELPAALAFCLFVLGGSKYSTTESSHPALGSARRIGF